MQFLYSGLTSGSIYGLVALGFNIIYNTTGLINFAQGEFVMLGGMLIYTLFCMFEVPFYTALPLTLIGCFIIGALYERVFIHMSRYKTEVNLITVTIAASIIMRDVAMHVWGRDSLRVDDYIPVVNVQMPGGVISSQSILIIAVSMLVAWGLNLFLKKSKYGKAMRACFDDQRAAETCGISVRNVRIMSFAVSSVMAAIAGIIISPITFVTYDDGIMIGLKGFAAAILGGLGNFWAAVAGGLLLGIFESFSASVIPSGYKDAMAFFVILLILFLKPDGLFGKKKAQRV
ncbi:branched-chain amino acid ABC transporter permease [Seleniivibrio woodruffii]|uniref:Amino acid/amide ABC transporter membrane protein 1 (HAAT family) n=1 Tax=Seleniivibrio woodruffii TaxID=1078050 RepID=A0A4V2PRW5_9BACT|nr:branched-chain amino acid ABC transporter permease [Seleniivibrio woodruffii]TCK60371.1 amino acid/amide ABC transporter membrane protein 1 (HAAT family) [Seleniivibrio woodruffii]TVZ35998.1 amino acid/amide ABC transporter membrane protein 1 (HAAT family) [Seleniivibrio woodruffii]